MEVTGWEYTCMRCGKRVRRVTTGRTKNYPFCDKCVNKKSAFIGR